jgi:hypothetical protein
MALGRPAGVEFARPAGLCGSVLEDDRIADRDPPG